MLPIVTYHSYITWFIAIGVLQGFLNGGVYVRPKRERGVGVQPDKGGIGAQL